MAHRDTTRAAILTFGRMVRAHRNARRISQAELGRLSRVGAKFIGQIERAESNPSLATMALVADALGCSLTDLIQDERKSAYVTLPENDIRKAQDALGVLRSVLTARRRAR